MFYERFFKRILWLNATLLLILFFIPSAVADFVVNVGGDITQTDCFVTHEYDEMFPVSGVSLRLALAIANGETPNMKTLCRSRIKIKTKNVFLEAPITITQVGNVDANGNANPNVKRRFVIEGADSTGTTIVVKNLKFKDEKCAINILSDNVELKDITVQGLNVAGKSAICVGSLNNTIGGVNFLNNVKISSASNAGILFMKNSLANVINYNSQIESVLTGILDENDDITAGNIIKVSSASFMKNDSTGVDDDGFIKVDDAAEKAKLAKDSRYKPEFFKALNIKSLMTTNIKSQVIIEKIEHYDKDVSIFELFGAVVDTSKLEMKDGKVNCNAINDDTLNSRVAKIAVFSAEPSESAAGTDITGFVGFVGRGANKGMKLADKKMGKFDFVIDKDRVVPSGFPTFNKDKFILVAMNESDEVVAKPSNVVELGTYEQYTECQNAPVKNPVDPNNPNGGSGGGTYADEDEVDNYIEFLSSRSCNFSTGFRGGSRDREMDSDGDQIPDYIEAGLIQETGANGTKQWVFKPSKAGCSCDNTPLCWKEADSDYDGIIDNIEFKNWAFLLNAKDGTVVTLADTDSDGNPDVRDDDSDNDGKMDGQEDRSSRFVERAKAYLFDPDGKFYLKNGSDKKVLCNGSEGGVTRDELREKNGDKIGVNYAWYIVNKDTKAGSFIPQKLNESTYRSYDSAKQRIQFLACRNDSLYSETNFDGNHNIAEGESNSSKVDTDGDCVCDGDGEGCKSIDKISECSTAHKSVSVMTANSQWLLDQCPNMKHPTRSCAPQCIEGLVLEALYYTTDEKYVTKVGSNYELKKDAKGVPLLFKLTTKDPRGNVVPDARTIKNICGDRDQDNIPDCVEQPISKCPGKDTSMLYLDPTTDDTDGDAIKDDIDRCPFDATNKCDPLKMYGPGTRTGSSDVFTCYWDPDVDGVPTCYEDLNRNGVADKKTRKEDIMFTESDPLVADSDGDGINDRLEMYDGWPFFTNPVNQDTDGDGLSDKEEDNDGFSGVSYIDLKTYKTNSRMCPTKAGMKNGRAAVDTDPREEDTDKDGLSDKEEAGDGIFIDPIAFANELQNNSDKYRLGAKFTTDPTIWDSDGDGLSDGDELNDSTKAIFDLGTWDSNPCAQDTDGDTKIDSAATELKGCAQTTTTDCRGTERTDGKDRDRDGLADDLEIKIGTDPGKKDSDEDGINDKDELKSSKGESIILDIRPGGDSDPRCGERYTDADLTTCQTRTNMCRPECMALVQFWSKFNGKCKLGYDTDHDGLNDMDESIVGTHSQLSDTDGDGILDGLEKRLLVKEFTPGGETNPANDFANPLIGDTDGDGLNDGDEDRVPNEFLVSNGGTHCNFNGMLDYDDEGKLIQTNPQRIDTNGDGTSDYDTVTNGTGILDLSRIHDAVTPYNGCSMVPTAQASLTSGLGLYSLLMISSLLAMRRRKLRDAASNGEGVQKGLEDKEGFLS